MGYKPAHASYNIEFAGHPGLELRARGTSLGKLLNLIKTEVNIDTMTVEEARNSPVFSFFIDRVISWNLEHPEFSEYDADGLCAQCHYVEGAPLPVVVDSLLCLDLKFIMELITGWMEAVASLSPGKGPNTNNGGMTPAILNMMTQLGEQASPLASPLLR